MPVVSSGERSSFLTLLNRPCNLFVWLSAAICAMAQVGADRYPIVRDGKVGFIDSRGNEVIAPQFFPIADMAHFHDGLAPVAGPDGAGYIDPSGRFVIGPNKQWGQPRPFHEGIAAVLIWGENGAPNTPAFIDQTGKIVLAGARVSEQAYFAEGLMPLSEGRRCGFVDKNFRWVIPPKYDFAEEFSEGLAPIQVGGKWGYIDKEGTEIVSPKYHLVWQFSDGLGRIRVDIASGEKSMTAEGLQSVYRHQFGFVDRTGKEVIHPQFEWATNFHQGRAFAMLPGARRFGIIDKHGTFVHEPEFDQSAEFHEGLAAVSVNGVWGYVDTSGEWIIIPRFSSADDFGYGLARVVWKDGYGYIDHGGTVLWKVSSGK